MDFTYQINSVSRSSLLWLEQTWWRKYPHISLKLSFLRGTVSSSVRRPKYKAWSPGDEDEEPSIPKPEQEVGHAIRTYHNIQAENKVYSSIQFSLTRKKRRTFMGHRRHRCGNLFKQLKTWIRILLVTDRDRYSCSNIFYLHQIAKIWFYFFNTIFVLRSCWEPHLCRMWNT